MDDTPGPAKLRWLAEECLTRLGMAIFLDKCPLEIAELGWYAQLLFECAAQWDLERKETQNRENGSAETGSEEVIATTGDTSCDGGELDQAERPGEHESVAGRTGHYRSVTSPGSGNVGFGRHSTSLRVPSGDGRFCGHAIQP